MIGHLKIFKVKLPQFLKYGLNYSHFNNYCIWLSTFSIVLL